MKEEMNCRERLYATLEQKGVDRISCPGILQTGTVELMDACGAYWPEAHWDAEKMAKLAWAAYEVAGLEGVRVPMHVYAETEALGCKLDKWKKDIQPVIKDYKEFAVKSLEDIDKIEVPDPKKDGKLLPPMIKAIEILAPKCEKEKIPLTVMPLPPVGLGLDGGIVDIMKGMMWLKTNMKEIKKLVEKLKEIHLTVAKACIDAGADIILYNNGILPEVGLEKYLELGGFEIDKECIKKEKEWGTHVIMHSCSGRTMRMLDKFCETGIQGISIAEMIPTKEAREIVSDKVALVGGLNQLTTLLKGKPEEVKAEAEKAIEDGVDILAPGCGFGPKTPIANMKAMVETAKEYGAKGRLARK